MKKEHEILLQINDILTNKAYLENNFLIFGKELINNQTKKPMTNKEVKDWILSIIDFLKDTEKKEDDT